MNASPRANSDYIVFVDESGSPTLGQIDVGYPVFVLVFCILEKRHYLDTLLPAIHRLKFDFFGHDMTILHSRDIRRSSNDFSILQDVAVKHRFVDAINRLVESTECSIVAQVIDKRRWSHNGDKAFDPYHLALRLCLLKLSRLSLLAAEGRKRLHLIAECRGKTEDRELGMEFARFKQEMENQGINRSTPAFELVFADKKANSAGLQLADLVAHPIGRHYLKPDQPNRAFDVLQGKISGAIEVFP